jgi:hypothetical protein
MVHVRLWLCSASRRSVLKEKPTTIMAIDGQYNAVLFQDVVSPRFVRIFAVIGLPAKSTP